MDGNLATTYTLIHSFLTKRSHSKAAQALKKAAKEFIILKDDIDVDGPQLDDIIQQWKALNGKKLPNSTSESDSDSSSDDSSPSSTSTSSDSSSDASDPKPRKAKKSLATKPPKSSSSLSDSDANSDSSASSTSGSSSDSDSQGSSSSDSSSSESGSESDDESSDSGSGSAGLGSNKKKPVKTKKDTKRISRDSSKTLSSGSKHEGESDSSSGSNSEGQQQKPGVKGKKLDAKGKDSRNGDPSSSRSSSDVRDKDRSKRQKKKLAAKKAKESSSSSSSSDSAKEAAKESTKRSPKTVQKEPSSSSSDLSSSDSDSDSDLDTRMDEDPVKPSTANVEAEDPDEVKVTKKRRTSESGAAIPTAMTNTVQEKKKGPKSTNRIKGENGNSGRKVNTPFRRVDPDIVPVHVIKDNRYEAKAGPNNDYGQRAHADLIVTRGAGFRKEKNKKKRGSYRGGEITMESHSFKFT